MTKRIFFAVTTRFPSSKTNYLQTLLNANALAGHAKVTFVTQQPIAEDVFKDFQYVCRPLWMALMGG